MPRFAKGIALLTALVATVATVVLVGAEGKSGRPAPRTVQPALGTIGDSLEPRSVWPAGSVVVTDLGGRKVTVLDPSGALTSVDGAPGPLAALAPGTGTARAGTLQVADETTGAVTELGPAGWQRNRPPVAANTAPQAAGFNDTAWTGATGWLDQSAGVAVFLDSDGTLRSTAQVGSNPRDLRFAPAESAGADRSFVLSSGNGALESGSVTVISPDRSPVRLPIGVNPTDMAIAGPGRPDEGSVYAAVTGDDGIAIIDPRTLLVRKLTGFSAPIRIDLAPIGSPDPRAVYVLDGHGLHVLDDDTGTRHTVDLPGDATDMAIAPTGTPAAGTIYITHESGRLTIIDPATLTVATRPVGRHPAAVTVIPTGGPNPGEIVTANLLDGTISILNLDGTPHSIIDVGGNPVAVQPIGAPS